MTDAARKHGGRRHAVSRRRTGVVWVSTAAVLVTAATVAMWPSRSVEGPTAAPADISLDADPLAPSDSGETTSSDPLTSVGTTTATLSPGATTTGPVTTSGSGPASGPAGTGGSSAPRTSTRPGSHPTSTTRPAGPGTTTVRPGTGPTTTWRGTVRPCKSSCVIVRNWFENGTQGWAAPAGGSVTPASPGYRDSSSVRASGVTTTAGPSLTVPDLRLSGPDRRWVSVRVRVRVTDAGGARLRLKVDGAAQVRMRELAADGDWQILRAWFLPQGPVKLTVVAAPSRCSSSPRLTGVYLDDVLATVLQPGEEPYGVATPYVTCW